MSAASTSLRRTATGLTLAGALPFIGLAIAMAFLEAPTNATAGFWLQVYAAVILSFLGGIRWGMALAQSQTHPSVLVLSVLPALAGWVIVPAATLLSASQHAEWYLAFAALFALQLVWDWSSQAVPGWFKPVRLTVSLIVIGSLAGAWLIQVYLF
ncbi:DUF3429 domain-containing protein [Henriciella aquimarina]|uniref:DUF3429 domain-containing protein n=1 Tax=Henriciella aquimarina TaxID=545261 RepID=UPI0009FBD1D4|nr:DUF3429 domain-containing protein [Henriciella aquimarina]